MVDTYAGGHVRRGGTKTGKCLERTMRPKSGGWEEWGMHTERRRHGSNEGTDRGREECQNHLSSGLFLCKQFWNILIK